MDVSVSEKQGQTMLPHFGIGFGMFLQCAIPAREVWSDLLAWKTEGDLYGLKGLVDEISSDVK
jgi:hypothetical protein